MSRAHAFKDELDGHVPGAKHPSQPQHSVYTEISRHLDAKDGQLRPEALLRLQRSAGNRATVALLAAGRSAARPAGVASPVPHTLQRRGKKKRRRGGGKSGGGGGQQKQPTQTVTPQTEPSTQQGWLGALGSYASSVGSMLWGSTTSGTEGEGNIEGGDVNRGGLGYTEESDLGGQKEPEGAPKDLLNGLMDIPRVAIKLEKEFAGGSGKVSGSGGISRQGASGKAKVEWNGALHKSDTGPVKLRGDNLTGRGTFFAGLKTGGELEGNLGYDEKSGLALGSKGKLAAFAGVEMKGETEVLVLVGGHETKMKGALGLTLGVGGELSYWLNFEGGKLTWGTKGKGALGVGASWEYQLELPVASMSTSMWSWLASGMSGLGSGVLSGLNTAADYLEYYGFLGG